MQALKIIDEAQSGTAIVNLAETLGISEAQARAAVEAALPEMIRGIERNTLSRAGLADLVSAIGRGHHERILDTPAIWTDPRAIADGQAALNHIMGSERNAERLAASAAQMAGLGSGIVKLLLPILAQWLLGALTKSTKGGLGDILSRLPIPGGASQRPSQPRSTGKDGGFDTGGTMGDGTGFDLPKSDVPTGGYPMPPIPGSDDHQNAGANRRRPDFEERSNPGGFGFPWPGNTEAGDGSESDGARSGSGMGLPKSDMPAGGYPMPPIPPAPDNGGSDNPYGDLSDILRRGGRLPSGDKAGGRGLGSIVRDTIGGALGFGNKGIVGWIIQLLLLRWGWSFLRRILFGR